MEKSRFENFSDLELKRYMTYVQKVLTQLNIEVDTLEDFFLEFNTWSSTPTKVMQLLSTPLGSELERLDIEYIFYILDNNPFSFVEGKELNRPTLDEVEANYITEEVVRITYTRTGQVSTYCSDNFDGQYLEQLRQTNDVEPWEWEITDENNWDTDIREDYFEIV